MKTFRIYFIFALHHSNRQYRKRKQRRADAIGYDLLHICALCKAILKTALQNTKVFFMERLPSFIMFYLLQFLFTVQLLLKIIRNSYFAIPFFYKNCKVPSLLSGCWCHIIEKYFISFVAAFAFFVAALVFVFSAFRSVLFLYSYSFLFRCTRIRVARCNHIAVQHYSNQTCDAMFVNQRTDT